MSERAAKFRTPEDHPGIFLAFAFLFYRVAVVFWGVGVFLLFNLHQRCRGTFHPRWLLIVPSLFTPDLAGESDVTWQ